MAGRDKRRSRAARFFSSLLWLAVFAGVLFWLLDRSLPPFARHRIEDALSSGAVAVTFDGASFNVFRGLTLKNVSVFRKQSLDGPLVRAETIRLGFDPGVSRPWRTWLSRISLKGLYMAPYPELEAFFDAISAAPSDGSTLEELLDVFDACDPPPPPIRFAAEQANVLDVRCRFLDFDIALGKGALRLEKINIVPDVFGFRETLTGNLVLVPENGNLDVRLSGTITPDAIRALTLSLEGDTAVEYYDAITAVQAPFHAVGEVSLRSDAGGDSSDIRLTLSGGDFLYHGHPVQSIKMGLQWLTDSRNEGESGRRLVISPLDATFRDGKYSGRLAWYPRTHATDLQAKSSLPVKPLLDVIEMPMPDCLTNLSFATPPRIDVGGRVFPEGLGADAILGHIAATRATAFRIPLDDISAEWGYDGEAKKAWIHEFTAECCGGRIDAAFDVATDGDNPFSLQFAAKDIRTDPLRKAFGFEAPNSDGTLSIETTLSGNLSTNALSSLSGSLEARARRAAITRIPLFAGLTDFIARNVVGIDLLVMQSDSDVSLVATNGLVTVSRMTVDGNMMSIVGKGKCRLDAPDMPAEGVAQVRFFHSRSLMGYLARIITLPVSKLMEFRIHGPIAKPSWDYIGLIDRIAEATFWPRKDATVTDGETKGED